MTSLLLLVAMLAVADSDDRVSAEILPLAQRSLLLDIAGTNKGLVAVGERGHVLLSADGSNWRQAKEVPTRATLTAVTVVGDALWAVGHDAVIIHSDDGGEHWTLQRQDPELYQPLLDVLFLDRNYGIAIGAYGYFLLTEDGGQSWDDSLPMAERLTGEDSGADGQSTPPTDIDLEFIDFHLNGLVQLDDNRLFIAAEAGHNFISDDRGLSWRLVRLPYHGSMFGALADGDDILTYGLRGHVFTSADGGLNWRERETDVQTSLMGGVLTDQGRVILVGANGTILERAAGRTEFTVARLPGGDDLAAVAAYGTTMIMVGEAGVYPHASGAAEGHR